MMQNMRSFAFALCVLAACGDDGGNNNKMDAGVDIDGQDIDAAPPAAVKVTVTGVGGLKQAGVRVHFQNPDSTLVASADTDANGVASAVMPLGGYVTAVNPFPDPPAGIGTYVELRTFAGVKAGDNLILTLDEGGQVTDVTATAPLDATAGVVSYLFATPCDSQSVDAPTDASNPQVTLGLYGKCLTSTDIVIASLDDNGEVVHWLYAAGVAPASSAIDLSAMTLATAPTTKTLSFTNIPTAIPTINVAQQLASSKGVVIRFGENMVSGPSGTTSWKLPPFTNAIDLVNGITDMPSGIGSHAFIDWGAFSTGYTTDVGARLLIEPTTVASFDTAMHQVKWTPATTGVAPEFAYAFANAFRATGSLGISWQITAPYASGVVQFPTLPVENSNDYNFAATDTTGVDQVILGKVTGGYDAVRAVLQSTTGPQDLAVPGTTGGLTYEQFDDSTPTRQVKPQGRVKMLQKPVAPTWKFRRRM
jgi:hypothetical protein